MKHTVQCWHLQGIRTIRASVTKNAQILMIQTDFHHITSHNKHFMSRILFLIVCDKSIYYTLRKYLREMRQPQMHIFRMLSNITFPWEDKKTDEAFWHLWLLRVIIANKWYPQLEHLCALEEDINDIVGTLGPASGCGGSTLTSVKSHNQIYKSDLTDVDYIYNC